MNILITVLNIIFIPLFILMLVLFGVIMVWFFKEMKEQIQTWKENKKWEKKLKNS